MFFMAGAKVEYLFYLLQAKIKKIISHYESLTFNLLREPFGCCVESLSVTVNS
jgi:hypothetical protein